MIELEQEVWHEFVYDFTNRLNANYNVEEALKMFVEDYWAVLDGLASEACEKEEELTELDANERISNLWDFVYGLEKQLINMQMKINNIETFKYQPTPLYPNKLPPGVWPDTHTPPWKVTSHATMNDSVPLSGVKQDRIHTTGYMQTVDPRYTQEQIDEWSKVRYTPPEGC